MDYSKTETVHRRFKKYERERKRKKEMVKEYGIKSNNHKRIHMYIILFTHSMTKMRESSICKEINENPIIYPC